MTTPADRWRHLLRGELLTARKQRDTVRVAALRSALAAVDNAETPDDAHAPAGNGPIAGSVAGLGAAEVARRTLSDEHIRALITAEVDERVSAADAADAGGFHEHAALLRSEAEVLTGLLSDVGPA
ncbi:glutamyl-tRNA amidotransferase [Mycolicibacterium litorale]|uniref:glutamyl-tRNA amidotransferase n=1 Tax=Mycolicibacterium litorale TaxID=758802 RepID=UPI003CE973F9